jgi:hypothetical protein
MSQKVRVFGLKTLFLERFTVRSTNRTLIIDKTDHSAFSAIKIVLNLVGMTVGTYGCVFAPVLVIRCTSTGTSIYRGTAAVITGGSSDSSDVARFSTGTYHKYFYLKAHGTKFSTSTTKFSNKATKPLIILGTAVHIYTSSTRSSPMVLLY